VLAAHQRDRVLAAALEVFAGRGYRATTVDDLVAAAGIGVGSFYALFSGKEGCFLSLYDRVVADARGQVAAAVPPPGACSWAERALAGLRGLLDLVDAEPARARIVVVEAPTAGPAAERRYAETVAELTAHLRAGRGDARMSAAAAPEHFEDAAVAGLAWVLHRRLVGGEGPQVAGGRTVAADLLPPLGGFLVSPFERR
jgi:AcrR family transcriptional regulator